jgi:sulfatase maturation enzyme AslB (radical SAM superfamily)
MWGMKDYYLGHISNAEPLKLKKVFVGEPCTKCDVFPICGGRCLYANVTKRWKTEDYGLVCDTVRNLVGVVVKEISKIRKLVKDERISLEDLEFMKYNGCEIIP